MTGSIVHFEIAGRDGSALEHFYNGLLGWEIDHESPGGHSYGRVNVKTSSRITAGIRHEPDGPAEVVMYFQVPDVEEYAARAVSLGGSIRVGPTQFEDIKFAVVSDPEGNPVGLVEGED